MRRIVLPVLLALAVAACDSFDPYEREGSWRPASARGSDGQMGGAAVERLRADRVRPLPASRLVQIGAGGGGGGQ